jgi:hypothetical protein
VVDGGLHLAWKTLDVVLQSWPGLPTLSPFHSPQPLAFSEMISNRHKFWVKPRPDKEDEF